MAIIINSALRLPAPDIEALIQGSIVTALTRVFVNAGSSFALYPSDSSLNLLPLEKQYRSKFLPIARDIFQNLNPDRVFIRAWATCQLCQSVSHPQVLDALSDLTIWTPEGLKEIVAQRQTIFLTYFRVCLLPRPVEVASILAGNFIGLKENLNLTGSKPVLKDQEFIFSKNQIENVLELQNELIGNIPSVSIPQAIDQPLIEIKKSIKTDLFVSDLSWISDIVNLGDRSIEIDEKKSTVKAGTDFENIVKKSLEFLGFTVDHVHAGGSGGLDLFCSKPFPLIGECKSGKSIPGNTVYELDNLSGDHLDDCMVSEAHKLIIGAGKPTPQLQSRAVRKNISIINPRSLQKLVELNYKYSGSINLIELRPYLIAGQSDLKVDEYIQKVESDIKLRSHIVSLVKNHHEDRLLVQSIFDIYPYSNPPKLTPKREDLQDILIELSSPLAGYLGRVKGDERTGDRFYYLRDLPCN